MDSSGIGVVVTAQEKLVALNGSLHLRNPTPIVERVVALTGLHLLLERAGNGWVRATSRAPPSIC
jgi:anti-anti-sigma factor